MTISMLTPMTTGQRLELVKIAFLTEVDDVLAARGVPAEKRAAGVGWLARLLERPGALGGLARGVRGVLRSPVGAGATTGAGIGGVIGGPVGAVVGGLGGGLLGGVGSGVRGLMTGGASATRQTLEMAKDLMGKGVGAEEAMRQAQSAIGALYKPTVGGAMRSLGTGALATGAGALGLGGYLGGKGIDAVKNILGGGQQAGQPERGTLETLLRTALPAAAGYFGTQWLGPQMGLSPEVMQYLPWLVGAGGGVLGATSWGG